MAKTIGVIGALDTKGQEFLFVKEEIERRGHRALVIDLGVVGEPGFKPDIPAERVAEAGGTSLNELREKADRGQSIDVMSRGIVEVVKELFDQGGIDGLISMEGRQVPVSAPQPCGPCLSVCPRLC